MEKIKQFSILITIILVIVIGSVITVKLLSTNPPQPKVIADGKKVEVIQGSYCWNGHISSVCADTGSPSETMKHHQKNVIIVSSQSKIKITFKYKPQKNSLNVTRWLNNDTETESVPVKNQMITVPKEKGVYIYSFDADWEEGDASYFFSVKVD